ncbi:hypothetical protein ACTXT7_000926 [Hymenolepis weldensis]
MIFWETGFLFFALAIIEYSNGSVVPIAYTPELGVQQHQLQSYNIKPILIKLDDFTYPPHSNAEVYRATVGKFNAYFGLNTTAENVAYFIIGHQLPITKSNPNWLHMEPDIVTLSPVVTKLANSNPETEIRVFVSDESIDQSNVDIIKGFADAGAYLGVVTPALSSSNIDAVNFTVRYIEKLASHINDNGDISINGETVQFTSANFLRLIQSTKHMISTDVMGVTIDFSTSGELQTLSFYFCEFQPYNCSPGFYKLNDNSFEIGVKLNRKKIVKLLAFQDMTFLPSFEDMEISMAIQMIKIIFTSDISYSYEIVNVPSSSNVTVQETLVKTLNDPQTAYTMSAFPILLNPNLDVQYTHAVLYDGIVVIKIREATAINLFHIFDIISGFIWLCVFVSLIFVALIFFAIKIINDYQMKQLGEAPEDNDIPLFRQFFNVIYQNFSAVLLAKVLVKPKQPSIRLLYQSYWIASILFVATYAAALAEQRFLVRESPVPFDSLRGLAYNSQNYRWFFIRNSSAVWKIKVGLNFTEVFEVSDIKLSTL